jgi:hypothetical protein
MSSAKAHRTTAAAVAAAAAAAAAAALKLYHIINFESFV